MPLRFNKEERDEWRSRMAGKSHTCAACCDGNCKDCSGTCDCSKCSGSKGASVLDALESKIAHEGQCPMCGGPSKLLGRLGNRTHYRCENCGMDHSSEAPIRKREPYEYEEIPNVGDNANFHAHVKTADLQEGEQLCSRCHGQGCADCQGTGKVRAASDPSIRTEWEPQQVTPRTARFPLDSWPETHKEENALVRQTPGLGLPCPRCNGHGCPACGNTGFVDPQEEANARAPHLDPERTQGVPPVAPQMGPIRWSTKLAEASMPPEAPPYQQKETALPYNPEAYESQVQDMHPAAQYAYQRAVQTGSDPQTAYQAAQEKQGEMGKRAQEGQNTQGVQIPVINTSYHGDKSGFVSAATIERVSHLIP